MHKKNRNTRDKRIYWKAKGISEIREPVNGVIHNPKLMFARRYKTIICKTQGNQLNNCSENNVFVEKKK